jgi:hypothetical protein
MLTPEPPTHSERLFEQFCARHRIPCDRIPRELKRTPDYRIRLAAVATVICEIKQIDPNEADLTVLQRLSNGEPTARYLPNRVRTELGDCGQLRRASRDGFPTLFVLYDNTPLKSYVHHYDVVTAMCGRSSVRVSFARDQPNAPFTVSEPFFGGDRGLTDKQNTSVSAIAILDDSAGTLTMRVYHNPYARVPLSQHLFDGLAVEQRVLPGDTTVSLR